VREGGHEEQRGFLRSLHESRAAAFRKEIVPHFRYVFQSGFGLFASAIFFSVLVWYIDFIKAVPKNWPADLVGVVVLSLAVIHAPLRTYFRSADSVFLLPMEGRVLQTYIRPALNKAIIAGVLRTLAVFAVFVPIYTRSPVTENMASGRSMVGM
jgi:ABC-2 type transport system permease protein